MGRVIAEEIRITPMANITVRRPGFEWPKDLSAMAVPSDPSRSCELVALSFTMPYLEPYLIRTMRLAAKKVDDPELGSDMKAFSGQEAQHFQNHAQINDLVRAKLSPQTAAAMEKLEGELDADYRRFTDSKSLAFNLAYAEGFEAMTFALARCSMESSLSAHTSDGWRELMGWHLLEEIEHRTVTYDAYENIVGRYWYRVIVGGWAQIHYGSYLLKMARVLQQELVDPEVSMRSVVAQALKRNWKTGTIPGTLKAMSPRYNPRRVPLSPALRQAAANEGIPLD